MTLQRWALLFVVGIAYALASPQRHVDEGSLRTALDAVTRKQRSLDANPDDYYNDLHSFKYYDGRDRDRDDNLEFLPFENGQLETIGDGFQRTLPNGHWADEESDSSLNSKIFDRMLLDYLGSEENQGDSAPSAFRERERERSGSKKRGPSGPRSAISDEALAELFLEELQDGPTSDNVDEEYLDNVRALYELFKHRAKPDGKAQGPMSWGGAFGKGNFMKDPDQDLLYLIPAERRNVNGRYPLGREFKEFRELRKRYPVAKRSPKAIQQKRQVTDAKVAQDLGKLFGKQFDEHEDPKHDHDQDHDHEHDHDHDHDHNHDHDHEHNHDHEHDHDHDQDHGHNHSHSDEHEHNHDHDYEHERTSEAPKTDKPSKDTIDRTAKQDKPREHPIEVQKKSVDWSQYFGIDRRKKASMLARAGSQGQDDEWLLQQYYKTMAENLKPSERVASRDNNEKRKRLQQMDSRLKNDEDLIIEEPLKFGGLKDAIDIQKVKDNIMARAAASYKLEKMWRALNEYQNDVASPRLSQKSGTTKSNPTTDLPNSDLDEKRISHHMNSDEGADDGMNCAESEVLEKRCKALDRWLGGRTQVLYPLCLMHQICEVCVEEEKDDNLCDKIYAAEATRACDDHEECLRAAREVHNTLSQLQAPTGAQSLCLCELQAQSRK